MLWSGTLPDNGGWKLSCLLVPVPECQQFLQRNKKTGQLPSYIQVVRGVRVLNFRHYSDVKRRE